jgi:uncharacterized protein involved in response to NO
MKRPVFLARGFRPFFAGACLFACLAMALWLAAYSAHLSPVTGRLPVLQWHAHEMIFGYALAVIAGFLLTAAQNWTGIATLHGAPLAALFALWCGARIFLLPGVDLIAAGAICDLLFLLSLLLAIASPVIRVRQKRQAPILLLLALLVAADACFYLGLAGWLEHGLRWGMDGGLYLVLGLVLFMGRRVIPFFTEGGTGRRVEIPRPRWIDVALLMLYPLFLLKQVFLPTVAAAPLALALFGVTLVQLAMWYTPGIWRKPLLWSLFFSFAMISMGFLLQALAHLSDISSTLPLHAFTVGGIGTITLSMMARVSLGHTGRNVHESPFVVTLALLALALAAVLRVFLPLLHASGYLTWVLSAGLCWISAFACFAWLYLPMLVRPRIDGKPG